MQIEEEMGGAGIEVGGGRAGLPPTNPTTNHNPPPPPHLEEEGGRQCEQPPLCYHRSPGTCQKIRPAPQRVLTVQ